MDVIESPCRPKYMLLDKAAGVATAHCALGPNTSELWSVKGRQWNCEHTYIWQDWWHQWEVKTVVPIEEIKNIGKGEQKQSEAENQSRAQGKQPPLNYTPVQTSETGVGRDALECHRLGGKWLISASFFIYYGCSAVRWWGWSVGTATLVITKADASHSLHYCQWAFSLVR